MSKKCFGIAGWKNSGKTSLVANLVQEISSRGLKVSTVKHAHHSFDLDTEGTDSFKHREAGAGEVVLISSKRWAIQHELKNEDEPPLSDFLEKLSPCDLILVEGYKQEGIPKLEIIGPDSKETEQFWPSDNHVKAVASDTNIESCTKPQFTRNDIEKIADFILEYHDLGS